MNGGDVGAPIGVYEYPRCAWQFTGRAQGDNLNNPNIPIDPSRTIEVRASLDGVCYTVPLFTFTVMDAAGMNARTNDPIRISNLDGAPLMVKPIVGGNVNPNGGDCSLILFCSRLAVRTT